MAYLFVGIFLSLIGYMVYFNVKLKDDVINSPYNSRQNAYEERIVRGEILANDGTVLARTDTDEEGNETRVYPMGEVFAHVVGYMASGKSGLESSENYTLLTSHANPVEKVTNEFREEKNKGDNLVTTLDANLQQVAYDALQTNGAVVVMEPDTGKILACVSKPDFDPNTLAEQWDEIVNDSENSSLVNRAFQGLYPPGSTFKIVTALSYLRQNGTLDGFSFDCEGELTAGGYTIHCYNSNVHGHEDFAAAFANSCNTAFSQIGLDLNRTEFAATAEDLLFNRELPLELPYSRSSFTLNESSPDALTMQTAIGQGDTLATPIHMAMIAAAVANDGVAMTPYLVDRVETYEGTKVRETAPEEFDTLMTAAEAATLTDLMQGVVENGTAKALQDVGVSIAGKTGSAEHGDLSEPAHSWFAGFSNVEDPDIVVCVIAEKAGSGSEAAVPIARQIFNAYYNN